MRLAHVAVRNFKGLRAVDLPLSRFVCVIGPNNAGKSSLLQALLKFIEGGKLSPTHYYDPNSDIAVAVTLRDISDADLGKLAQEHRAKIEPLVSGGSLTLVRRYASDGTSRLRTVALLPIDPRFGQDAVDALVKAKKPGGTFAAEVAATFPELKDEIGPKSNQGDVRDAIARLAAALPAEQKQAQEVDLPTGFDNSVRAFLPEPIYIPAVKDLADEIKTKDSASFGKLLGILMISIKPHLLNFEQYFTELQKLLNRSVDEAGVVTDTRLEAVKLVEGTVQKFVQENFPNVGIEIQIPPPELKSVLGSAEILASDGVPGPIDTKGDGLKRAVTFAILRAYVELRNSQAAEGEDSLNPSGYLFLFEEPELYLYPLAQRILFDALRTVAQQHHVVVSTHSPSFFEPKDTETFVKMVKRANAGEKPHGVAIPVDLSSLDAKARFQLIGYETNNTAFFSNRVLLVEGDSDLVVVPYLSKLLNPKWSFDRAGLTICRIQGKGSIGRYREFFQAFDVPVMVLGDLDCLLDGFDKCGLPEACVELRSRLLQQVDCVLKTKKAGKPLNSEDLKKLAESPTRRDQWERMKQEALAVSAGSGDIDQLTAAFDAFFDVENDKSRVSVIREAADAQVLALKRQLLAAMRESGVFVWEHGSIEDYYPPGTEGHDKPSKALDFCRRVTTSEQARALCPTVDGTPEFDLIFGKVFAGVQA